MSKILVVGGAWQPRLTTAAALAMADATCQVIHSNELVLQTRQQHDGPVVLEASTWEPEKGSLWYQKFAGRRGKPPRY